MIWTTCPLGPTTKINLGRDDWPGVPSTWKVNVRVLPGLRLRNADRFGLWVSVGVLAGRRMEFDGLTLGLNFHCENVHMGIMYSLNTIQVDTRFCWLVVEVDGARLIDGIGPSLENNHGTKSKVLVKYSHLYSYLLYHSNSKQFQMYTQAPTFEKIPSRKKGGRQ